MNKNYKADSAATTMNHIMANSQEQPFTKPKRMGRWQMIQQQAQEERVLREIDELFGKPKTKHYVSPTITEQRIYDNALTQMERGVPAQQIASSLDCQMKMVELNRGI